MGLVYGAHAANPEHLQDFEAATKYGSYFKDGGCISQGGGGPGGSPSWAAHRSGLVRSHVEGDWFGRIHTENRRLITRRVLPEYTSIIPRKEAVSEIIGGISQMK